MPITAAINAFACEYSDKAINKGARSIPRCSECPDSILLDCWIEDECVEAFERLSSEEHNDMGLVRKQCLVMALRTKIRHMYDFLDQQATKTTTQKSIHDMELFLSICNSEGSGPPPDALSLGTVAIEIDSMSSGLDVTQNYLHAAARIAKYLPYRMLDQSEKDSVGDAIFEAFKPHIFPNGTDVPVRYNQIKPWHQNLMRKLQDNSDTFLDI